MGKPFTEEDRVFAKTLLEQGHSFAFIADKLGRDQSVVRRWAVRLQLVRCRRPWTEEDRAHAIAMRARGADMKVISNALERSQGSITGMLSTVKRVQEHLEMLRKKAEEEKSKALKAKEAQHDPYVRWMVAQERLRRRVDRVVNTA
jgi:transposase